MGLVASALFFRTPLPFLLFVALVNFFQPLHPYWVPVVFFVFSILYFLRFYIYIFEKKKRLNFAICQTFLIHCFQFLLGGIMVMLWEESVRRGLHSPSFLVSLQKVVVFYAVYNVSSAVLILAVPLLRRWSLFADGSNGGTRAKGEVQKIDTPHRSSHVYSLHFSLFLMRQEFVKLATMVHTMVKMGREADDDQDEIKQRLGKYLTIVERVGSELKELCFSVGKQRAYRWHVREVLSYYKSINQLELLAEDLNQVLEFLQKDGLSEEIERECRVWLRLQLKIYEVFFQRVCGVETDEEDKIEEWLCRSYEVLDRLLVENNEDPDLAQLSKVFYRLTESNGLLSRPQRK